MSGGRRLVLKNPVNTARVRVLLEMFPDARFVHIHRNPLEVFGSTRRLMESILAISSRQDVSPEAIDDDILHVYREVMGRFLADRHLPPSDRLVPYTALLSDPLAAVRTVYDRLDLPWTSGADAGIRAAVASGRSHRPSARMLDDATRRKVVGAWAFAFEAWGYPAGGA